jgi:very-short-patch-repair endonuclease
MAGTKRQSIDSGRVWALVGRQHDVVARGQLIGLGLTPAAIEHRLRSGRLHRVRRGVYSVGTPTLTGHGRWMAAVLACGDGSVLSHGSAAALWRIGRERRGLVEVSVLGTVPRRRKGLLVHRRTRLKAPDIGVHEGVPVTSPVQSLIDLAAQLGRRATERAVNEADIRELVDPPTLRAALDRHPGEPGVDILRTLLDRRTFRFTRTELERWFIPLAAEAGLPVPLTAQWVNGFEVDFYWPGLGLVVETDGLRYHRTPAEQARDRVRDQTHTAAGLSQLRFTHEQIRYEPDYVRSILRRTVDRIAVARGLLRSEPIGP